MKNVKNEQRNSFKNKLKLLKRLRLIELLKNKNK